MTRQIGPWSASAAGVTLDVAKPSKHGRAEVTATVDGRATHVDRLTLGAAEDRTRFLKALALRLGEGSEHVGEQIDAALIALNAEIQKDLTAAHALADAAGGSDASESPTQGRLLVFPDLEPWPDPVDGAALLDDIVATVKRYAVVPDWSAEAIALWTVHTYTMDSWYVSPFLTIHSPLKRCGKSTVLKIAQALVHRPISTANITPAALFRVIEKHSPTMLFDEAQEWIDIPNSELRAILNAGHYREQARTFRVEGDDHQVVYFSTWAPKLIALVGNLPDMMMDRSIVISMRRRRNDERLDPINGHTFGALLRPLQRRCKRFVQDHAEQFEDAEYLDRIRDDRARDNWSPLLTIAREAGSRWLAIAQAAAVAMSDGGEVGDETPGLALLSDIRSIFDGSSPDAFMASAKLVERLKKIEDRPWADFKKGQGITTAWLARELKRFKLPPATPRREDGAQVRGYLKHWFSDAWARYLPPTEVSQCHNANNDGPESRIADAEKGAPVTLQHSAASTSNEPVDIGSVTPVTPATLFSAPSAQNVGRDDDGERF